MVCAIMLNATTVVEKYGQLHISGSKILNSNDEPVQLRGMSLFWSQWQGKYYNYNTLKWLRDDWKISVIRAAMGVQSGGYITNKDAEKAKIKTVVDAAIDLGIYVIIDWHSHSAENLAEASEALKFFDEMSKLYGNYPNVIYEPYNEPLSVSWNETLKPYFDTIIKTIRVNDPDNIIVCGTSTWSQDVDDAVANPITISDNIAYTVHYYADTHKQWLRDRTKAAIDKGFCVFITEFGTCKSDGGVPINEPESQLWFEFMNQNMISWCNWSVADKPEAASCIVPNTSVDGNWSDNEITESGNIVRNELLYQYYLSEIDSASKPILFTKLADAEVGEGMSYEFSVKALSPDTLIYEWYFDSVKIDGADKSQFSISNFNSENAGIYYVLISNSNGTISSDTVELSIINRQPYNGVITLPGTIEAENYDIGGNGYTYYDTDQTNKTGSYRDEWVDIEASIEAGGYQVGYVETGEWMEYTVDIDSAGEYSVDVYIAAQSAGGVFSVIFGDYITLDYSIPSTGDWKTQAKVSKKAVLQEGEQIVRFLIKSKGPAYNIDRVIVKPYEEPTDSTDISDINKIFSLYPNPATDYVFVNINSTDIIKYELYNTLGVKVLSSNISKYNVELRLNNFDKGLYYFKLYTNSSEYTKTLLIE